MHRIASRTVEWIDITGTVAVFVCLYQGLRVLFSALFGVAYDALFGGTVSLLAAGLQAALVVLALLSPLAAPRRGRALPMVLLVASVLVFLARIPLTFDEPRLRLAASLVIVAAAGVYLAARLRAGARDIPRTLVLALAVDQLLRVAGQTWDVTLRPAWWSGQIAVSLALCLLAGWRYSRRPEEAPGPAAGWPLSTGLAWGGWLFLETSLLAFPNAMARWGDESYWPFALSGPIVLVLVFLGDDLWRIRRRGVEGVAVVAALLGGMAAGYLFTGAVAFWGLLLAQFAALVLLFSCLSARSDVQVDRLAPGLALGGVLFLVLSFAYAFTFTYAYTLDLFRDAGLPIFLAAGLVASLPAMLPPAAGRWAGWPSRGRVFAVWGAGVLLVALVLGLDGLYWPRPAAATDLLRAATYNMHYGYDSHWRLSLEAQARAIEASGAGIVALQEVDAGRPTSYMIDDVVWLGRRLNMEVVFFPCVEHLTGIALLSRYPVLDVDTLLLPSRLEQTGIIWAGLDVDGEPVNAFAIWMGLEPEERARQLDAVLPFLANHPGPAVFGGDFNSAPDSPVYARVSQAGFVDPFQALGLGSPPTDPAIDPDQRIDFVWLRDLTPVRAWVSDSTASDHRLVVVEATWP